MTSGMSPLWCDQRGGLAPDVTSLSTTAASFIGQLVLSVRSELMTMTWSISATRACQEVAEIGRWLPGVGGDERAMEAEQGLYLDACRALMLISVYWEPARGVLVPEEVCIKLSAGGYSVRRPDRKR